MTGLGLQFRVELCQQCVTWTYISSIAKSIVDFLRISAVILKFDFNSTIAGCAIAGCDGVGCEIGSLKETSDSTARGGTG